MSIKIIVVAERLDDVLVVSPRTIDRVRGINAKQIIVDPDLAGHPQLGRILGTVHPCIALAPMPEPHTSGSEAQQ